MRKFKSPGCWKPGQSGNPAGRKKGVPNKFTTLKAAFINAFNRIGGEDALVEWVQANALKQVKTRKGVKYVFDPSVTGRQGEFYKILARMLPQDIEVGGKAGRPIYVVNGHRGADAEK